MHSSYRIANLQTAIDGVAYAMGQTDEWKGTGSLSFIDVKREKPDDEESTANKPAKKETAKSK